MNDGNLLVKRHPAQRIVDALLNGYTLVKILGQRLSLGIHTTEK
jgi:hypothetical protein